MMQRNLTIATALLAVLSLGVAQNYRSKAELEATTLKNAHEKLAQAQAKEQSATECLQALIRTEGDLTERELQDVEHVLQTRVIEVKAARSKIEMLEKRKAELLSDVNELKKKRDSLAAPYAGGDGELDALYQNLLSTTYHNAVEQLYQRRLLQLLDMFRKGASVNTVLPNENGTTALHNACGLSCVEIVRWLVNHGADLDIRTAQGASVEACVGGSNASAILQILSKARQERSLVHREQWQGSSHMGDLQPFINEISRWHTRDATMQLYQRRLLTLLPRIQNGAHVDLTLPETKGNTALHYACGMGYYDLVRWLVEHGANVNARTNAGKTPKDCTGGADGRRIREYLNSRASNSYSRNTFTYQPVQGGHASAKKHLGRHGIAI